MCKEASEEVSTSRSTVALQVNCGKCLSAGGNQLPTFGSVSSVKEPNRTETETCYLLNDRNRTETTGEGWRSMTGNLYEQIKSDFYSFG